MATSLTTTPPLAPVYGLDSLAPVYYDDGNYRRWNFNQIYFGDVGQGKFVPTVDDLVDQIQGNIVTVYRVASIHPQTLVATLVRTGEPPDENQELDVYITKGTFRAFIDKSVNPYRLSVDVRYLIPGSDSAWVKIFRGVDTSVNGVVVSGIYDQNGEIIDENVPLELVATQVLQNHTLKSVQPCHTTFDLINGEELTLIVYNNLGFVVGKGPLLVEESTFVREVDAYRRYVVGIHLESPFVDPSSPKIVRFPLNINLTAMNLMGVVTYSDGLELRLPVNGARFSALGLDAYAPTIVNQETDFILKYKLPVGEYGIGQNVGDEVFITEPYRVVASEVNGKYAVKLYCYPVWVDATTGYRLEWYLYDLNRSVRYMVTPQIRIDTDFAPFQPKTYGAKQTLRVAVNLKQVNGSYKDFNHVQLMDVTLTRPGNERPNFENIPNWTVAPISGQTPVQGPGAYATFFRENSNTFRVKVSAGLLTLADFLNAFYRPSAPLFNPYTEANAPSPTHFRLLAGNNQVEYDLIHWNQVLTLSGTLANHSTVYLQFFSRTTDNDLQLSTVGVPLFQVDELGTYL